MTWLFRLLPLVLLVDPPTAWSQEKLHGAHLVDLELALLVDVSSSVNDQEYRLQAEGLAAAFRDPRVIGAIRTSAPRGIAVGVVQWADARHQVLSLRWSLVRSEADALRVADELAVMPRLIHSGHTAPGDALIYGLGQIETNRYDGLRRVIDLSGDGRTNDGQPLRGARQLVLEAGVTINGLAILNEIPLLASYFRDRLIGGEGAFVMTAQDYGDFAQAMIKKLVREISAIPLTHWKGDGEATEVRHSATRYPLDSGADRRRPGTRALGSNSRCEPVARWPRGHPGCPG